MSEQSESRQSKLSSLTRYMKGNNHKSAKRDEGRDSSQRSSPIPESSKIYREYNGPDHRDGANEHHGNNGAEHAIIGATRAISLAAARGAPQQYDDTPLSNTASTYTAHNTVAARVRRGSENGGTGRVSQGEKDRRHIQQIQETSTRTTTIESATREDEGGDENEFGRSSDGGDSTSPQFHLDGNSQPSPEFSGAYENERTSVQQERQISPRHRKAVPVTAKHSLKSDIVSPTQSIDFPDSPPVLDEWDGSGFEARHGDFGLIERLEQVSPSRDWNRSTQGYTQTPTSSSTKPSPEEKGKKGSHFAAFLNLKSSKEPSYGTNFPSRPSVEQGSRHIAPEAAVVDRPIIEIKSLEHFGKIMHKRLFNEYPHPGSTDLKKCYNYVERLSIKFGYELLSPYIESRANLKADVAVLQKKQETHEGRMKEYQDELEAQRTQHELSLQQQAQRLVTEKDLAVERARRDKDEIFAQQLKTHEEVQMGLEREITQLTADLIRSKDEIAAKTNENELLIDQLAEKDVSLESGRLAIEGRDQQIRDHKDDLARKRNEITRQKDDIAGMTSAISNLELELHKLCSSYDEKYRKAMLKADEEKNMLISNHDYALTQQATKLQRSIKTLQDDLKKEKRQADELMKRKKSEHRIALQTLEESHRKSGKKLRKEVEDLKRQKREAVDRQAGEHEITLQNLKTNHKVVTDQLQRELKESESSAREATERQSREHDNKMQALKNDHDAFVSQLQSKIEETERSSRQASERKTMEHNSFIQSLQKEHDTAMAALKGSSESALRQMVQDHEDATAKIYQDRQEINTALKNRDNNEKYQASLFQTASLPRKTDDQIRESFLGVRQLVEGLGRSAWKKNQPAWTEQLIRKVGSEKASREFRRAVVQNAIWVVLFKFVFGSPFRIFGEAGEALERQWAEHSGEVYSSEPVYSWPTPGISTERWRYFTLKSAYDALRTAVSQYDPRMELRIGFKSSQAALVSELKIMLEQVIELSASDEEKIQRLSKQAFTLWLDYSMHRCRIVVYLKKPEDQSTNNREEPKTLTMQPLVGRYGNVTGVDLEIFKVIDGCGGDFVRI